MPIDIRLLIHFIIRQCLLLRRFIATECLIVIVIVKMTIYLATAVANYF